jgi:uncharacterized repeat protein (TIGR04052 family)
VNPFSPSRRSRASSCLLAALWACSEADGTQLLALTAPSGSAAFALTGIAGEVNDIDYAVSNAVGDVVIEDTLRPDAAGGVRIELDLPAGAAYRIALTATTTTGLECRGSSRFDIAPRDRVEVVVELACESTGGHASVTGTLTPAEECPRVEIATAATSLALGASLILGTAREGEGAGSPVWSASSGELASSDGVTRFSCTEAGAVEIVLSISGGGCDASDSVTVTCTAPATSACDGLGSTCHVVDATSAEAHECHELGHGGDEAACAEGRAACIETCGGALCSELGALCHDVDPGSGPLHECHELGHAGDATACFARGRECHDLCTRAHEVPITIQFAARVGDEAFACGGSYEGVGSSGATVFPQDFRLFVHDVRLIAADGSEAPVSLDERAPFQALGTALLDFEDATGLCLTGDAATNSTITGRVAPGEYDGVAFRIGVPEAINHANPATQPAPLAAGNMAWGWLAGYRFLRAELGAEAGGGVLHLGSAACTGDPVAGSVSCARPNRADVALTGFDVGTDTIIADIGAIFASTDLGAATLCHSTGAACEPMFASFGLALASGQSGGGQNVFRVAP